MMEGSGSGSVRSVQIMTDPDPKTQDPTDPDPQPGTKHQLKIEEGESMLKETQNELLKNLQIYLQNICMNKQG
jgi:hypothetical protein